ncbi:hypothetical protein TCON_1484 [Astathelohania contejeani]|uniref:Rho-GAP domain-containing protein n=1 Tax=Astathelohania contejeani TaxID=164912 RepID=A0ABQ7HYP0_9MICR|nr:hypothetical protein TCON_1484 [Thelohania contejeani]
MKLFNKNDEKSENTSNNITFIKMKKNKNFAMDKLFYIISQLFRIFESEQAKKERSLNLIIKIFDYLLINRLLDYDGWLRSIPINEDILKISEYIRNGDSFNYGDFSVHNLFSGIAHYMKYNLNGVIDTMVFSKLACVKTESYYFNCTNEIDSKKVSFLLSCIIPTMNETYGHFFLSLLRISGLILKNSRSDISVDKLAAVFSPILLGDAITSSISYKELLKFSKVLELFILLHF